MMKIGYQGISGSNSQQAAYRFIEKLHFDETKLIPLINSERVCTYLLENKIDYGVVAIENSIGGIVTETERVLDNNDLVVVSQELLNIHHCLFKKKGVLNSDIKFIASHVQAIFQTKNSIAKLFSDVEYLEVDDTALAAKLLCEGKLSDNTAVICSKKAGLSYNLECIMENIEDEDDNFTKFLLLKNT